MHVLVLAASAYLEKEDAEWRIGLEVGMFTYIPLFEMTGVETIFFGCMSDSKTFWFPIQLSSSIAPGPNPHAHFSYTYHHLSHLYPIFSLTYTGYLWSYRHLSCSNIS